MVLASDRLPGPGSSTVSWLGSVGCPDCAAESVIRLTDKNLREGQVPFWQAGPGLVAGSEETGSGGWDRTNDLVVNSHPLCR